ncbi:hypothetical protein B0H16DRAFT_1458129 [Mycena metata]|uniref:Uncharacterized protein n=1 Tax=Mycena metata TaxID=1033252 RepID=A0AAD7NDT5_9AGAR|nr:hypothetical protein B0H16DRAFT_1458129 [Mycena metata]
MDDSDDDVPPLEDAWTVDNSLTDCPLGDAYLAAIKAFNLEGSRVTTCSPHGVTVVEHRSGSRALAMVANICWPAHPNQNIGQLTLSGDPRVAFFGHNVLADHGMALKSDAHDGTSSFPSKWAQTSDPTVPSHFLL